jgi:transposase-like protein
MEEKRTRRVFTPEQKFAILKDIETYLTVKAGLAKYHLSHSVYQKWKRQLAVGIRASLRNSKPLKAPDLRHLEAENKKLKEVVLNQSLIICELKKEMNWA